MTACDKCTLTVPHHHPCVNAGQHHLMESCPCGHARWPIVTEDERKSRAYAFLGDRTSQPDGSEWDHDRLRHLVNDLLLAIR